MGARPDRARDTRPVAVVTAQLSGNALGRVLPGGGATAIAVETSMLGRAGVEAKTAVAGLGASTVLQVATTLALPVLALPAVLGGASVANGLATAAYLGAAALALLIALGRRSSRPTLR